MREQWTFGFVLLVAAFLVVPAIALADDGSERPVDLTLNAELGFVAPVYHRVQFSRDGTYIDYVEEGGQNVLFSFARLSVDAQLSDRHRLTLLWQPLDLQTRVRAARDLVVDGVTFPEGTPVDLRYSFPFYRLSYAYDIVHRERTQFALGPSLQIRNATLSVQSGDGELRRDRRDVGLVPILKVRARHQLESQWFFGLEADGFYAPIRYLNISDNDVVGAILDASLFVGAPVGEQVDAYLNLRYLGGGADGTSPRQAERGPSDGYTRNWLNLVTVSLGLSLTLW